MSDDTTINLGALLRAKLGHPPHPNQQNGLAVEYQVIDWCAGQSSWREYDTEAAALDGFANAPLHEHATRELWIAGKCVNTCYGYVDGDKDEDDFECCEDEHYGDFDNDNDEETIQHQLVSGTNMCPGVTMWTVEELCDDPFYGYRQIGPVFSKQPHAAEYLDALYFAYRESSFRMVEITVL